MRPGRSGELEKEIILFFLYPIHCPVVLIHFKDRYNFFNQNHKVESVFLICDFFFPLW